MLRKVGIGLRVTVVFAVAGGGMAIPLWTPDGDRGQVEAVWRYPE